MPVYRLSTPIPTATPQQLFDWHGRLGAFVRLNPPFDPVRVLKRSGPGLEVGTTIELEARVGPVPVRWSARHVACEEPGGFTDVQVGGPFSSWTHHHRFLPDGDGSLLEDEIEWEAPLGVLGAAIGGVHGRIERGFAYRHARTLSDLARIAPFADRPRLTVAISGASGMVGTALSALLDAAGHQVLPMVRSRDQAGIYWNVAEGEVDAAALEGVDAVVLLAGASIASKAWTEERKQVVRSSRVQGVSLICRALASLVDKPQVVISGSAVGVYGDGGDQVLDEAAEGDTSFLAELGRDWEAAAQPAVDAGIRTVWLRTGIVLSAAGGYLAEQLPMFRAAGGGPQGSGAQYVPWIHLDDLIGMIHDAVHDPRWVGPVNGAAPEPVRQRDFAHTLGRVVSRPAIVPAPAMALRLALGRDKADELILQGQRAVPAKALELGFQFSQPDLEHALRFELGR